MSLTLGCDRAELPRLLRPRNVVLEGRRIAGTLRAAAAVPASSSPIHRPAGSSQEPLPTIDITILAVLVTRLWGVTHPPLGHLGRGLPYAVVGVHPIPRDSAMP
jgi:hypothetical protein